MKRKISIKQNIWGNVRKKAYTNAKHHTTKQERCCHHRKHATGTIHPSNNPT
jgi:hypothetical protein